LHPLEKKTSPIISLLQNKFAFLEFIQTFNRCALLLMQGTHKKHSEFGGWCYNSRW